MPKIISPDALIALEYALSSIYWYKNDLRTFVERSVKNKSLVISLDWSLTKREISSILVRRMSDRPDLFEDDLLNLMYFTASLTDFSHLKKCEDSEKLIKNAKESVAALKQHCSGYFDLKAERELKEQRKQAYEASRKEREGFDNELANIKRQFEELITMQDVQARGYAFEKLLNSLFLLFDLQPRKAFRITGAQIDGAFSLDGADYLLEAKWHLKPSSTNDLFAFKGKIDGTLKNTLGLFISYNGFVDTAIDAQNQSKAIILMDGMDLMQVLEGKITLPQMISLKKQHASQTGKMMYRIIC